MYKIFSISNLVVPNLWPSVYIYICFTYSKGLKCLTLMIHSKTNSPLSNHVSDNVLTTEKMIHSKTNSPQINLPFSFCYYYFLLRFYQLFFISQCIIFSVVSTLSLTWLLCGLLVFECIIFSVVSTLSLTLLLCGLLVFESTE
jgi:hypothetical protein